MSVNQAAGRYVRWLYRCVSSRPDLTLLAQVAGAVAVLENRPEDLAAVLHDELAIAMAAVADRRPELAVALTRLRPHSPVLAMALRHPALRPSVCAALASYLDDEETLARYLVLLRHPEGTVVKDALAGLAAFGGLRPTYPARARAVAAPLPVPVLSCAVDLLGHGDPAVVAAVLRALEGRVLSGDLIARVVVLLGQGDAMIATGARLVLDGRDLPDDLLAWLAGLLGHPDPAIAGSAQLVLDSCDLPEDLLARLVGRLADPDRSAAERATALLKGL